MRLFDLHCDTLYRALDEGGSIVDNDYHLSVRRGPRKAGWAQCFAVWIPDEYRKEAAFSLFRRAKKKFDEELQKHSSLMCQCRTANDIEAALKEHKCAAILTIEGGAALAGELSNLDYLSECGVRMMTLTWNDHCELGGGSLAAAPNGLTAFGKSVVRRMVELNMAIDISHASDALFYDVAGEVSAPLVASHSNSRIVCKHRRNLTDEQFDIICSRQGLVGLNFARDFLREDGDAATTEDIIRHAEYFLARGGEKTLCMGTDFDGAEIPRDITGIESMAGLYELFLRHNYSKSLVEDIFFNNAFNFFARLDKARSGV